MNINRNDIRTMVLESVRGLLNEISVADAYQRFYTNKVPENVYSSLMNGTDLMTPYHKFMLDEYIKKNIGDDVLAYAGKVWSTATNEAKQYLVNAIKDDKEYLSGIRGRIMSLLSRVEGMKSHTENSFGKRGLEVLYQDDNVLITCTKSYTSSHQTYGDSHWCTASDIFGDYNGFEMFSRYTVDDGNDILVQFIDLKNKESNSYQVQYGCYGGRADEEEVCTWMDKESGIDAVANMLKGYGVDYKEIHNEVIKPNCERLFRETIENLQDEWDYYSRKHRVRVAKVLKKINTNFSSEDFRSRAMAAMKESWESKHQVSFVVGHCFCETIIPQNGGGTIIIFTVEYDGYDDEEKKTINQIMEADYDDGYPEYYSATTQTWILNSDYSVIGVQQGAYGGRKDNIIRIKNEPQWGADIALVNATNGKVVAYHPADIEMGRTDHIIEVYPHGDEDEYLISSITGEKVVGRPIG